jgi:hypothetical protein
VSVGAFLILPHHPPRRLSHAHGTGIERNRHRRILQVLSVFTVDRNFLCCCTQKEECDNVPTSVWVPPRTPPVSHVLDSSYTL